MCGYNETDVDCRQSLGWKERLLVGILSAEAAAMQYDLSAFDIVTKAEAANPLCQYE
jgi:hypothetical protein